MSDEQRKPPARSRVNTNSENPLVEFTEKLANLDEALAAELAARAKAHIAATRPMQVLKTGRDLARAITKMHDLIIRKETSR